MVLVVVLWSSLLHCGRCGHGCGRVVVVVIVASWLSPWLLHRGCIVVVIVVMVMVALQLSLCGEHQE